MSAGILDTATLILLGSQAHLQQAEADFDPLPFDAAAARSFGQVAAGLRLWSVDSSQTSARPSGPEHSSNV